MKKTYHIISATVALGLVATACDEEVMEWRPSDSSVSSSELPLQLSEQIALYKPIKEYASQYRPGIDVTIGMGLDNFLKKDAYRDVVLENFNGVTFGNAMKHQSIVSASGACNWSTVDKFFAMNTGLKLHGHNLLWHTQQQQAYMKSLIAPKLVQEQQPGVGDGIANILVGDNSDFEGGTSGSWGSWGNGSSKTVEDGVGVDGSKAVVLVNPTDGSDYYVAQMAYDLDAPLVDGKTYKIKFQAKSSSGAGSLQIAYQNSTTYAGGLYKSVDVGADWVTVEVEFTVPEDGKEYNRLLINFGKVAATYYIDNIKFGEYSEPLPDPMENILVGDNSDFEGGTTGNWGSWGNGSTKSVEDGVGVDGSKAMVLVNPSDGSDYYVAQCAYDLDSPMEENATYILQFQIRTNVAAGSVQFCYQNSQTYSGGGYKAYDAGTDWVTVEHEFTVPEDGKEYNRVVISFGKVAATYYIDNVKFGKKVETAAKAPSRAAAYHYELKSAQEKREILLNYMETWIKEAMEHCGPYCSTWDVINEPIDDSGRWRGFDGAFMSNGDDDPDREPVETEEAGLTLNWLSGAGNSHWYWGYFIGKDYAAKAFEYAAKYNPNGAKLFVNDYNLETNPNKLAELIKFVEYIDANGGHVDGIGTQMHVQKSITKEQVDAMFKTLAATGKLIRITELDVAMSLSKLSAADQQTQADVYKMILDSYFENIPAEQQSGVTIWGLSDKEDEHEYWLKGDCPNIFDADYARKIAYKAVCDAIAGFDLSTEFKGDDWKNTIKTPAEDEGAE